jgi:hypothetical protein
MDNGRVDWVHSACVYCRSPSQNAELKSVSITPPTCPKCGLVQPSRSYEPPLSLQEERKLLSDRIELLDRRLASLQSPLSGLDGGAKQSATAKSAMKVTATDKERARQVDRKKRDDNSVAANINVI